MGYYVNTEDINVVVPKDLLEDAYEAICDLNQHDDLKRGGSRGPGPDKSENKFWFSWMPEDIAAACPDLLSVVSTLGFDDSEYDKDGNLVLGHYSNKTGQEDLLIDAIAPFVQEGSYVIWKGEDDTYYKWEFNDGKMLVIPGEVEVTWHPERAYTAMDEWKRTAEMIESLRLGYEIAKADNEKKEKSDA